MCANLLNNKLSKIIFYLLTGLLKHNINWLRLIKKNSIQCNKYLITPTLYFILKNSEILMDLNKWNN